MQIQFYQTYREEIPEHSLVHGWSHWSLVIRKHPLYLSLLRPFWPSKWPFHEFLVDHVEKNDDQNKTVQV